MTKKQFQLKIKRLQAKGVTIQQIADKINYSRSQVQRAKSDKWEGNCSRLFNIFNQKF